MQTTQFPSMLARWKQRHRNRSTVTARQKFCPRSGIRYLLITSLSLQSACQSISYTPQTVYGEPIDYSGFSYSSPLLRKDSINKVVKAIADLGCIDVEHIDLSVVDYEPSNGQPGHTWGHELWTFSACKNDYPFAITFTEDGKGGTFFVIRLITTPVTPSIEI